MYQGQAIGNYFLISPLGQGGMGEVWLAQDRMTGGEVAIKGLHAHLINDEAVIARFKQEAQTLRLLQHPSIVGLLDYVEDHNGLYLVLEYVDGMPLDDWIARESGPIPEEVAIPMFRQMLKGVDFAHKRGIIHRDIKPSNFLVDQQRNVRILDFGIAKYIEDDKKMTRTGTRIGTVYYMSPEQVSGHKMDHRSDIYAMGVTLYQMLTGQPPYPADSSEYEVLSGIVREPLPRARTIYPGVSHRMQRILDKATAKNPAQRFQSCAQFLAVLAQDEQQLEEQSPGGALIDKARFNWGRFLAWVLPTLTVVALVVVGYTQNWADVLAPAEPPLQVAEEFFRAVEDGDNEATKELATDACQGAVELFLAANENTGSRVTYRTQSETIDGRSAVVGYTKNDSYYIHELKLLKRQGKWRVSCDKENLLENKY